MNKNITNTVDNLSVNIRISFDKKSAEEKIEKISRLVEEIQSEIDSFPQLVKVEVIK